MAGRCYLCDKTGFFLQVYRCSNPACGKVFCQNCGAGWDHRACPACGNHTEQNVNLMKDVVDFLTPRKASEATKRSGIQSGGDARVEHRRSRSRYSSRRSDELESLVERLASQLERKGPPCPHCGGDLPADARVKAYRVCMHCRRDLFWAGRQPFVTEKEASAHKHELLQEAENEEKLIEIERAEMEAEEREERDRERRRRKRPQKVVAAGVAIHIAAVIASVDGRISPDELIGATAAFKRCGLSEQQFKERFIAVCRRVRKGGLKEWVERLRRMVSDQQEQKVGLTVGELTSLLNQLVTAGGGETEEKKLLMRQFTTVLES